MGKEGGEDRQPPKVVCLGCAAHCCSCILRDSDGTVVRSWVAASPTLHLKVTVSCLLLRPRSSVAYSCRISTFCLTGAFGTRPIGNGEGMGCYQKDPKRTTVTCNLTIATAHAKRFAHVCVLFRQACIYCEPWLAALLPNVVAEKCQAEQAHRFEFLESVKVHLVLTDTHNLICVGFVLIRPRDTLLRGEQLKLCSFQSLRRGRHLQKDKRVFFTLHRKECVVVAAHHKSKFSR